mmetsp:Transcript_64267/g.193974  ORF Transcript_64267/g.193974 Transcript_64267/m.193974 type:complete len:85 (+) Transcript_64267:113-367(+)
MRTAEPVRTRVEKQTCDLIGAAHGSKAQALPAEDPVQAATEHADHRALLLSDKESSMASMNLGLHLAVEEVISVHKSIKCCWAI